MKALTIWQPWATLIAARAKRYEFRTWRMPRALIGVDVAIHAAARPMREAEIVEILEALDRPYRGYAQFVDAARAQPILSNALAWVRAKGAASDPASPAPTSRVIATCRFEASIDADNIDDLSPGAMMYAWPIVRVRRHLSPPPAKGAQGFWEWRNA